MPGTDGAGPKNAAPAATGSGGALDELTERHWRLLLLIGEHGWFTTAQVTTMRFDSRPTAVRHLRALHGAGLLVRYVARRDPSHLAHYLISAKGAQALQRWLRDAGQPVPLGLGQRGKKDPDQLMVNDFFVRLVAHARSTGTGHLYRWRHALDTAAWLRRYAIPRARTQGDGVWIEDNMALSFLLHVDHDEPSPIARTPAPPPSARLRGYQPATSGVPANAALVITTTTRRELQLHRELAEAPLPLTVAVTTRPRLDCAASPADRIWTVGTAPTEPRRLREIIAKPT